MPLIDVEQMTAGFSQMPHSRPPRNREQMKTNLRILAVAVALCVGLFTATAANKDDHKHLATPKGGRLLDKTKPHAEFVIATYTIVCPPPSYPWPSRSSRISRGSAPLLGPTMPRSSSSSMIREARP